MMEYINVAQVNQTNHSRGVVDGVVYALMELLSNPVCLVIYTLAVVQAIFIYFGNSDDPMFWLYDVLKNVVQNPKTPKIFCVIIHVLMSAILFELRWRYYFVVVALCTVANFRIFDPVQFVVSLIVAGVIFLLNYNIVLVMLYSHLWLLYSLLNDPLRKFLIILFALSVSFIIHYLDPQLVVSVVRTPANPEKLKLLYDINKDLSSLYVNRTT
jgi:hypothetical protein